MPAKKGFAGMLGDSMDAILSEDMKRMVREQRLGFFATVCPDGSPNLSPKGTISVWDDEHLVFVDLRSPVTVSNLQINPWIEVNVVDQFVRKGYRFKGTAEIIRQGSMFDSIRDFYDGLWVDMPRFKRERMLNVFVLIHVKEARPLISPAYDDTGLTENDIRSKWMAHFGFENRSRSAVE